MTRQYWFDNHVLYSTDGSTLVNELNEVMSVMDIDNYDKVEIFGISMYADHIPDSDYEIVDYGSREGLMIQTNGKRYSTALTDGFRALESYYTMGIEDGLVYELLDDLKDLMENKDPEEVESQLDRVIDGFGLDQFMTEKEIEEAKRLTLEAWKESEE